MTQEQPYTIAYSRIASHRGALRIWMEGRRLSRAGIKAGDPFEVVTGEQSITLRFTANGNHTVSGRDRGTERLPIIDVRGHHLLKVFRADDRIRIEVRSCEIEITLHHQTRNTRSREERLINRLQSGAPLTIGSLAHGGGVLDLALHSGLSDACVPTRLAFANELEARYLEASLQNNPVWSGESIAIEGPMQDVEWDRLPKVDILVSGLPCTGASLSGRAKNKNHYAEAHQTAGSLFVSFLQAVTTLNPSVVVMENVPIYAASPSMMVIRTVLKNLEYTILETQISGQDYAALEARTRLCMVAMSRGLPALDLNALQTLGQPGHTLGSIMEQVHPDDDRWRTYDYLRVKAERDRSKGSNFKRQLVDVNTEAVGVIGRECWKARSTEPFIVHPSNDGRSRLLTPVEHARVKTVPVELVKGLVSTTAHEILGQSVIFNAFRCVGSWIGRTLLGDSHSLPVCSHAGIVTHLG